MHDENPLFSKGTLDLNTGLALSTVAPFAF